MPHSSYRKMIDNARKAGLQTGEIYRALAHCQPSPGERAHHQTDSNGFIAHIDAAGKTEFQSPVSLRSQ